MARLLRPISFDSFASMAGHLNRWAAQTLTSPEAWQAALVESHTWLDFAPRNQVLMISYATDGPACGAETWRLIPSSEAGRGCAVRAGEHGYPIRVPITTNGHEPDPFVGGTRPTRSHVERWEWRQVFSIDQLARKPAADTLTPLVIPESLTGPDGAAEFTTMVNKVVTATVRGKLQRSSDPERMLADAAARLRRSADRPELIPTLREQVAWLVAERVGHAANAQPTPFDPTLSKPRERWERLLDVLDPARKLTAALGAAVGVDLVRSSIPRMQIVDDRVVPAGRRHRLPAATFDALPVGRWVSVGPYTQAEWLARGELASGNGAFLRLNKTAYVVAVENGDNVHWRLEDVASRTGHGRLANGVSRDLDTARRDVTAGLEGRYPALSQSVAEPLPSLDRATPTTPTYGGLVKLDYAVADLADHDDYSRDRLDELIGQRLTDADRADLPDADYQRLVQLLGAAGMTAATTVAVLYADGCPAETIAPILPTLGVPMASAIRTLHERWDIPRVDAAGMTAATGVEMRDAGCSATEILTLRPESILNQLPRDPHLWELAAGTMATNGHPPTVVVAQMVNHAPSPECFAGGLAAAIDDPDVAIGLASRLRAQPDQIAAASQRYGLTPAETAEILRDERAPMTQAVAVLGQLCGYDDDAVTAAWRGIEPDTPDVAPAVSVAPLSRITSIGGADIGTAEELLAVLPPARLSATAPLFELLDTPFDLSDLTMEMTKT